MNTLKGIVFATKMECLPFIDNMKLTKTDTRPFSVYRNDKIVLTISGIGKVNAALATLHMINTFNLKHLYNIGACGALREHINIGEIYHVNKIIEFDRPPIIKPGPRKIKPDTLPGFPRASLATQDRPVLTADHRKETGRIADLADMEAAGFSLTCKKFGAKGYIFKIVTDTIKHNNHFNIITNIKKNRQTMFDFFMDNIFTHDYNC